MVELDRPRVVFLAGYGRSGSTVLDITLSQNPDIFGAGEITAMTRHVWQKNEFCACGEKIRDCEVWRDIVTTWLEGDTDRRLVRYFALQRRFEALHSSYLIRIGIRGKDFAEYCAMTEALFRAIVARTGRPVVLDSSKLPGRAYAFSLMSGIDLSIIHLVRDGRAVAHSMTKSFSLDVRAGFQKELRPKSVARTAVRWTLVNLMVEHACRRIDATRSVRVSYEAFTGQPQETLARIGRAAGLDFSETAAAIAAQRPIYPAHQMAGSRIRMKKEMVLTPDSSWQGRMSEQSQATVKRICGWLLRRYGYL